jgi:hypothetical protein
MENLATEVRSFYSLQDLVETIKEEINRYETLCEEYNQWLGLFLRDSSTTLGDQEWFKKLAALQKAAKIGKRVTKKGKKHRKKSAKRSGFPDWVTYREIELCTNEKGQAEIVFEAIEEINGKVSKLEKIKNTMVELEKSGLGAEINYIVFIRNGVPEKLVLRHKKESELAERFKFVTEISVPRPV